MKSTAVTPARFGRANFGLAAVALVALAGCSSSSNSGSSTTTNPSGSFLNAALVIGQPNFTSNSPNQGGAPSANTVSFGLSGGPVSVASDGTSLYIPDQSNHRILGFATAPTANNATANFVVGQNDFTSVASGAVPPNYLAYPGKVSVYRSTDGSVRDLVAADTSNNRVLIWNGLPTSNSQLPAVVIGQADLTTNTAGRSQTALSRPTAAIIAGPGPSLFVVDNGNNRVLIWNTVPTTNNAPADLVIGQQDFTHGGQNEGSLCSSSGVLTTYPASATSLNGPQDIWTDGYKIFISDSSNNRVLYYGGVPTENCAAATFVMGQTNYTATSAASGSQHMNSPYGVTSDGTHVYIADTLNNRVLEFSTFPAGNGAAATTVLGQQNFNHVTANDDDQNNSANANPSARTLNTPTGVYVGAGSNNLWVTDAANQRVLLFNPTL